MGVLWPWLHFESLGPSYQAPSSSRLNNYPISIWEAVKNIFCICTANMRRFITKKFDKKDQHYLSLMRVWYGMGSNGLGGQTTNT